MVLVLGDVHGDEPSNRDALERAYERTDDTVAIQVGDLQYYSLPFRTWFIAGNNEDFDVIERLRAGESDWPDTECAHLLAGTSVDLAGLTVAGLSGNYAPTQYEKSRDELTGDRRRHFTHEDIERAMTLDDVDVLLTHEAPHGLIERRGYDVGCEHVDSLLRHLDPTLCLVGHYHEHAEGRFGDRRVISLAPVWEGYYHLDPDDLTLTFTSWDDRSLSSF